MSALSLQKTIGSHLACPICKQKLSWENDAKKLSCGQHTFPLVDGRPVLINDENSVFSTKDFVQKRDTYFANTKESWIKRVFRRLMPSISNNPRAKENYQDLVKELRKQNKQAKVLVIGGSIPGEGFDALLAADSIQLIESDVAWGPRTQLICDAHDLPFQDNSFDGVILQAVLEHVVDPTRVIEEVFRVLKSTGLVYAETPFMQQVHAGRYDFTRFTQLGHRRLFRQFTERKSGAVCGTGMALAWSWQYFLCSFAKGKTMRQLLVFIASWTSFWWKYFDFLLINTPGTLDGASGFFFLGQKSKTILSDKDLLKQYKGML